MTAEYWPWWVGGPLLAVVALMFPLWVRVPLGVSGALSRLLRWKKDHGANPSDLNSVQLPNPGGNGCLPVSVPGGLSTAQNMGGASAGVGPDRWANGVFLLAIAVGGALAGWVSGKPWGSLEYAPEFHRLLATGVPGLLVLFVGGTLVGFGTRLSGGCTSGHGLSGCGRLQPASLVATAVFFGVAIGVSLLLEAIRS